MPTDYLSKTHRAIYDLIQKSDTGLTYIEIQNKLKIRINTVATYIQFMRRNDLVVSVETDYCVRYKVGNGEFDKLQERFRQQNKTISELVSPEELRDDKPDPLLEECKTFELSESQWNYIKANPSLSRKEIARKLGIKRTVLLAAIDKRKTKGAVTG